MVSTTALAISTAAVAFAGVVLLVSSTRSSASDDPGGSDTKQEEGQRIRCRGIRSAGTASIVRTHGLKGEGKRRQDCRSNWGRSLKNFFSWDTKDGETSTEHKVDSVQLVGLEDARGLLEAIGNTPLIRINSLSDATGCEILGKCEFLNPGGSVKDRVAVRIIQEGLRIGQLRPGGLVCEGSAGSTGVSLALVARAFGCRCFVALPDDVAVEKSQMLEALGAQVERVRPVAITHPGHFVNVARRKAQSAGKRVLDALGKAASGVLIDSKGAPNRGEEPGTSAERDQCLGFERERPREEEGLEGGAPGTSEQSPERKEGACTGGLEGVGSEKGSPKTDGRQEARWKRGDRLRRSKGTGGLTGKKLRKAKKKEAAALMEMAASRRGGDGERGAGSNEGEGEDGVGLDWGDSWFENVMVEEGRGSRGPVVKLEEGERSSSGGKEGAGVLTERDGGLTAAVSEVSFLGMGDGGGNESSRDPGVRNVQAIRSELPSSREDPGFLYDPSNVVVEVNRVVTADRFEGQEQVCETAGGQTEGSKASEKTTGLEAEEGGAVGSGSMSGSLEVERTRSDPRASTEKQALSNADVSEGGSRSAANGGSLGEEGSQKSSVGGRVLTSDRSDFTERRKSASSERSAYAQPSRGGVVGGTESAPPGARSDVSAHETGRADGNPDGGFFADQFENLANFRAHYEGTGPEIWTQTGGRVDAFVAGAGTGGTLAGVSCYLKDHNTGVKCYLVDPPGSGLYYKVTRGVMYTPQEAEGKRLRNPFDTITEGIGINRMTKNFEKARLDGAFRATDQEAVDMARYLLLNDGLFLGSSSAVNCVGAFRAAKALGSGHTIVTILCDGGHRHLSKFHNPEYLRMHGLAPSKRGALPLASG